MQLLKELHGKGEEYEARADNILNLLDLGVGLAGCQTSYFQDVVDGKRDFDDAMADAEDAVEFKIDSEEDEIERDFPWYQDRPGLNRPRRKSQGGASGPKPSPEISSKIQKRKKENKEEKKISHAIPVWKCGSRNELTAVRTYARASHVNTHPRLISYAHNRSTLWRPPGGACQLTLPTPKYRLFLLFCAFEIFN